MSVHCAAKYNNYSAVLHYNLNYFSLDLCVFIESNKLKHHKSSAVIRSALDPVM